MPVIKIKRIDETKMTITESNSIKAIERINQVIQAYLQSEVKLLKDNQMNVFDNKPFLYYKVEKIYYNNKSSV